MAETLKIQTQNLLSRKNEASWFDCCLNIGTQTLTSKYEIHKTLTGI